MLEPVVRNNLHRLHGIYDRFPSPARHLMTSARGWLLTRIRYSPAAFNTLRTLRAHDLWQPDEIRRHQLACLQTAFDHARATTPHYRNYPHIAFRSPDDLRALPILSREVVRRGPESFFSSSVPARQRIHAGTTGTTGANLTVAYSEQALAENWAFLLRQWSWADIAPRTPRLTLFGARIVPTSRTAPPFWTYNIPERQLLLSIFHLSAKTAPAYIDCLSRHRGKVLEGFPSVISILADFAERRGQSIPMRAIFTSGEPLYPDARAKIEKIFQSRIFDS
ncbi:MAG TPA: hypothetical protein VIY69_03945, partial [Candidatus Acidoferrales bacterium]